MSTGSEDPKVEELLRRVDLLERDNQRLREKMEPVLGPDNPNFDPRKFMKALQRVILITTLPIYLVPLLVIPATMMKISPPALPRIGPLPLVDFAGIGTRHPGLGFGILAFGGAAFGLVAVGGFGVGVIALGGGAIGVVAIGGGSVGLIAIGGGAVGYVAVGGGACGVYAIGQKAYGKHVLAMNRQDPEAIEFFKRWIPGLRDAVTSPMPVIPVSRPQQQSSHV
jgi:hypothetical protein